MLPSLSTEGIYTSRRSYPPSSSILLGFAAFWALWVFLEGIAVVEEALGASKRIKGAYANLRAGTCNCIQGVALGLTEFLHALNFRYVLYNVGGELVVSR